MVEGWGSDLDGLRKLKMESDVWGILMYETRGGVALRLSKLPRG